MHPINGALAMTPSYASRLGREPWQFYFVKLRTKVCNLTIMKTILFVEDEAALQKTLTDYLEEEKFNVISALDGETGYRLACEKKPDLILLDLILPRLHGLEVLKKLKETEETRTIPVIILTNLEDIRDVEKSIELGATTYLVKAQYSLEEVITKVRQALGESD